MTKDEKIIFPLMCKNTYTLSKIKEIFFKEYPEYSENKKKLDIRHKNNCLKLDDTLEECNIKNNDIIIFEFNDFNHQRNKKKGSKKK